MSINGCVINFHIVPLLIYFDEDEMKTETASEITVNLVILHFAGSSFLIYYYGSRFLQKSYPGRRLSIDFVKYLFQSPT